VLSLAGQRRFFLFLCESTLITTDVPACNVTMTDVRSKLTVALDGKRARFPRLHFLTDEELITFASLELNPTVTPAQTLICKCFNNLSAVEFDTKREIVAVTGLDGERLVLRRAVGTHNEPLEKWLATLDVEIRNSLRAGLADALAFLDSNSGGSVLRLCTDESGETNTAMDFQKKRIVSAESNGTAETETSASEERGGDGLPSQSVVLAWHVAFTRRVENILGGKDTAEAKRHRLKSESENVQEQVDELRKFVAKGSASSGRVKARLLIGLGTRLCRTLGELIGCPGKSPTPGSFAWQKRLRFYWDPASARGAECRLELGGAKLSYGFEFAGRQNRAVVTAGMERSFVGILGAVASGSGALITGEAGRGRAESVRALADAAGKPCIFETCTEKTPAERLSGMVRASAASGTWLCLRDVGRLRGDVASAVVQQLTSVRQALASSTNRVQLDGATVMVDRSVAFFLTAESDGPQPSDRLTSLCRATALGEVSTAADVAEGLLHAEGFAGSDVLGRKLATILYYASQQLVAQNFACGLRAVRAIVDQAAAKRAEMVSAGFDGLEVREEELLARVLERSVAPGLLGEELAAFRRLIENVFPNCGRLGGPSGRLKEAVAAAVKERGLHEVLGTVQKSLQLQDCMALGCLGTVVCGEAGTGKSELIATLARANEAVCGTRVGIQRVEVDGLSVERLAARCDEILRSAGEQATWVVFDGVVGPEQAELIHQRFDRDAHLFSASLEKSSGVKILFEVDSRKVVPSALLRRCALVHVSRGEAVDWNALLKSWVGRNLPAGWADEAALFKRLCEKALPACLELAVAGAPAGLEIIPTGLMQSFLSLLEITLSSFLASQKLPRPESGASSGEGQMSERGGGARRRLVSYGRKQARDLVSWRRLHLKQAGPGHSHEGRTDEGTLQKRLDEVKQSERKQLLTAASVFALVNSLGLVAASLTDHAALEHVIRDVISDLGLLKQAALPEGSLYDFGYSWQFRTWRAWPELRVERAAERQTKASGGVRFFVSTVETARNEVLARMMLEGGRRVALFGPGGSGKASLMKHVLQSTAGQEGGWKSGDGLWRNWREERESLSGQSFLLVDSDCDSTSSRPTARLLRSYSILPTVAYSFDSLVAIFGQQLLAAWTGGTAPNGSVLPHGTLEALVHRLSKASAQFHENLLKALPTPRNDLGLGFGTRDLFKLLDALVTNSGGTPASESDAVRLWAHEVRRVYGDPLGSLEGRDAAEGSLRAAATEHLREWGALAQTPVMFGQYSRHADANGHVTARGVYREVTDRDGWVLGMEGHLAAHNLECENPLRIVLFPEAVDHLSRLLRALRSSGAQAMLIGPPRSGKRSLLRLAAFVLGFDHFEIGGEPAKGAADWREKIGKAVERAALGDRGVVLGVKAGDPGLMRDVAQLRNGHEVSISNLHGRCFIPSSCQHRVEEDTFNVW
jgi:hypothetical protein